MLSTTLSLFCKIIKSNKKKTKAQIMICLCQVKNKKRSNFRIILSSRLSTKLFFLTQRPRRVNETGLDLVSIGLLEKPLFIPHFTLPMTMIFFIFDQTEYQGYYLANKMGKRGIQNSNSYNYNHDNIYRSLLLYSRTPNTAALGTIKRRY